MKKESVGLVLMAGGGSGATAVERALRHARQAAACDTIEQSREIPQLDPIIVASDDVEWLETLDGQQLRLESTLALPTFHFGHYLANLVQRYRLERCLYMGGGSAPLLPTEVLEQVVWNVLSDHPILVTNNLHSSDWAAFTPAAEIGPLIPLLGHDNALPWVWQEKAGLPVKVLPRSAASQMDIDTPFDLLALTRHPAVRPNLRAFLDQLAWPSTQLDATLDVLRREASQLIIAGRVSAWTLQLIERYTRTWVRVFSEERGMRASGRQARGEVRSLLNEYLDLVGVEQFFPGLGTLADAILLDSRVILASRGLWPSDADRFHSDLLLSDQIDDPFLRAFTAAAQSAPVPVVMGGHSLVAGGLAVVLEGAGLVPLSR